MAGAPARWAPAIAAYCDVVFWGVFGPWGWIQGAVSGAIAGRRALPIPAVWAQPDNAASVRDR